MQVREEHGLFATCNSSREMRIQQFHNSYEQPEHPMKCGKPPRCASARLKLLSTSPPHEWSNTFTVQVIPLNK